MSFDGSAALSRFRAWAWSFLRHHRPAFVGVVLVTIVVLTALVGPLLCGYGPSEVHGRFLEPNFTHWLGTDSQGYDILTRLVRRSGPCLARVWGSHEPEAGADRWFE